MAGAAADERAQAGDQLFGLEGLGEIIVGARIEARDLVRPAVARGEHEDGHVLAFLAPLVEHGEPVHLGQAEIEDDGVIGFVGAEEMTVLAIGGEIDRIARAFERRAELPPQIGFVFDDQDAHVVPSVKSVIAFPTREVATKLRKLNGIAGRGKCEKG